MTGALGFDRDFLPFPVPLPTPAEDIAADLATTDDGATVLDYVHFSLTMSRARKLARWVGWNIDGGTRFDDIPRDDQSFRPDPRLSKSTQTLNEVYNRNRLDRGHLARRADLLWGTRSEAEQANHDSFYFTNITPQMDNFNQAQRFGIWGRLEIALLEVVDQQRASVFAGPVLAVDDPAYRGVNVPREFWKLLAYELDGLPRVRIFLVTQNLVLEAWADPLAEFQTYAITVDELAERSHLQFADELTAHFVEDPHATRSIRARPPISSASSILW